MTRDRLLPFTLIALGAALAACAGDAPTRPGPTAADRGALAARHAPATDDGALYVAELHPLNPRIQQALDPDAQDGPLGVAGGKAYFKLSNGEFVAVLDAHGVETGMVHPQHIHAADRCPPQSADVNHDGYVDVIEGLPYYGPIVVPLDDQLSNLASNQFPMSTEPRGTYHYTATALLDELSSAVEAAGFGPLALETRHVVVHGVDPNTFLPPSVQSLGPAPAFLTLPVACGPIHRVG